MYRRENPNKGSQSINIGSKRPRLETMKATSSGSRFQPLADDDDGNNSLDETNKVQKQNNSLYPPITVLNATSTDIKALLAENQIKFLIKITGIGPRIQCITYEGHHKCIEILKTKKIEYYTYQAPEDKVLKFVLSGLPAMKVEEIKKLLIEEGLKTITEVLQMKITNKRYDDHVKYLVKFKRNSVNINSLRTIKALDYTIIKWEHYKKKDNSAPICYNCMHFGHASSNCNLKTRCSYCGDNHIYKNCPHNPNVMNINSKNIMVDEISENAESNKQPSQPKCCNCGKNHIAISEECDHRKEYLSLKEELKKNRNHQYRQNSQQQSNTINSSTQYNNRNYHTQEQKNQAEVNHPSGLNTSSFININRLPNNQHTNTHPKYSDVLKSDDSFSLNEIIGLVNEIISKLSVCKNKAEQFAVITQLSVKYLFDVK